MHARVTLRPVPPGNGASVPSPYVELDRAAWARLREQTPMTLDERDLTQLRGLGDRIDLKINPDVATVFGLVAQGVWTSVLCISGTYSELLNYVIFATIIFYFLTTFSLFRLRRVRPDLPRPVRAFGYPVLPALYMAANVFLLVVLLADPQQRKFSALGLLIVALGIPVYLVWRRNRVA